MPTDDARVNFFDKRVLGKVDLKDRFLDYVENWVSRGLKMLTTGPTTSPDAGFFFADLDVVDGAGVNMLTFADGEPGAFGFDGKGDVLSVLSLDSRITEVPFEDAAVTYYMAARIAEEPQGIEVDQDTGDVIDYDRFAKTIGDDRDPSAVVDGGTNITFTVGNHQIDGADDFTGRTAIVFMRTPITTVPGDAIETVVITAANQVVTTGTLGQSTVSTTASDYGVIIVGPVITRSSSVDGLGGFMFIGTVVGGGAPRAFDLSGQARLPNISEAFGVPGTVIDRGWITRPDITGSPVGTTSLTYTASIGFVNNTIQALVGDTLSTVGILSSDIWYGLVAAGPGGAPSLAAFVNDFDGVDADNVVPAFFVRTDGAGLITHAVRIGRSVSRFNRNLHYTVATDADLKADFPTLASALYAAWSTRQKAAPSPEGILIEVIGNVTEPASISDVEIQDLENVVIKGRGVPGTPVASYAGPKVTWSFNTAPLFVFATNLLKGWSIEDVYFEFTGAMGDDTTPMIGAGGGIEDLSLRRVYLDGHKNVAGGAGGVAHLLVDAVGTGGNKRISIRDCIVETTHSFVELEDGEDIVIQGNTMLADLSKQSTGTQVMEFVNLNDCVRNIRVLDNWVTGLTPGGSGHIFNIDFAASGVGLYIRGNHVETSSGISGGSGACAIRLAGSAARSVYIENNDIDLVTEAFGIDMIVSPDDLWLRGNRIKYTPPAAADKADTVGLEMNGAGSDLRIEGNTFEGFDIAVRFLSSGNERVRVVGNSLLACGTHGVEFSNADTDYLEISSNTIKMTGDGGGTLAAAINFFDTTTSDLPYESVVISKNMIEFDDTGATVNLWVSCYGLWANDGSNQTHHGWVVEGNLTTYVSTQSATTMYGINIDELSQVAMYGNVVHVKAGAATASVTSGDMIRSGEGDYNLVFGNIVHSFESDGPEQGVSISGSSNSIALGNIVRMVGEGTAEAGLQLGSADRSIAACNLIDGPPEGANNANGIDSFLLDESMILGNLVHAGEDAILAGISPADTNSDRLVVVGNWALTNGAGGSGIELNADNSVAVGNNTVGTGLTDNSTGSTVANNEN